MAQIAQYPSHILSSVSAFIYPLPLLVGTLWLVPPGQQFSAELLAILVLLLWLLNEYLHRANNLIGWHLGVIHFILAVIYSLLLVGVWLVPPLQFLAELITVLILLDFLKEYLPYPWANGLIRWCLSAIQMQYVIIVYSVTMEDW